MDDADHSAAYAELSSRIEACVSEADALGLTLVAAHLETALTALVPTPAQSEAPSHGRDASLH